MILYASIAAILFWSVFTKRTFEFACFLALTTLSINLVGMDPPDFLFTPLLVVGILRGFLRMRPVIPPVLLLFGFLFLISHAVSDVVGDPPANALGHYILNCVFFVFLLLFLESSRRVRLLLLALITGQLVTNAIASLVVLAGSELNTDVMFESHRSGRWMGMMGDPNALAFIASICAIWVLDEIFHPKLWHSRRAVKLAVLAMLFIVIPVTLSRSGTLGLLVALLTYAGISALIGDTRTVMRFVLIGVVVVSCTLAALIALGELESVTRRADVVAAQERDPMEQQRATFFFTRRAIQVGMMNPEGLGTGRTERFLATPDGMSLGAHNTYIQIFADNGWATFICFMIGILYIVFNVFDEALSKSPPVFGVSFTMLAAALSGLATNAMFHDLEFWSFAYVLPATAAIMLSCRQSLLAFARRGHESLAH